MAEPKYRFVKMKKPPRGRGVRGAMARQKFQRSGGRKKQILNPETGKYVDVLSGEAGKRQLQKFYPTKERGESIKKVEKAKVEQSKRKTKAQKKFDAAVEETKKKRKERAAKAEPPPPPKPAPVAKTKPKPKPKPVAKAKPKPAPTKGKLTRGPGSEAPPPPPRIRITEEKPKPPVADLSELPIRDQKELNAVLKDLKNRVISPDFKTPTQDEIAEAVTKATGGRFTPPTSKVAEPPPPKVEPVVPAPTGGMSSVVKADKKATPGKLSELFGGIGGGKIKEPTKIDIPGAGQVTLPTKPSLPEGVAPGGKFYDHPVTGDPMYQPPMPGNGIRAQVLPIPINLRTGKAEDFKYKITAMPDEGPQEMPQEAIDAAKKIFSKPTTPTPTPMPEPTPVVPAPAPAPPPPQFVNMDPLRGVRERYVPTNILGQSFDPGVREDYARRMMQAGANVQQGGSPTFQMPTSAVPQVQFGGYGAPVPMAPLAPYAGLGGPLPPPPPPQLASGAVVNPGTGEVEPIGYVPPSIIQGPIT